MSLLRRLALAARSVPPVVACAAGGAITNPGWPHLHDDVATPVESDRVDLLYWGSFTVDTAATHGCNDPHTRESSEFTFGGDFELNDVCDGCTVSANLIGTGVAIRTTSDQASIETHIPQAADVKRPIKEHLRG